ARLNGGTPLTPSEKINRIPAHPKNTAIKHKKKEKPMINKKFTIATLTTLTALAATLLFHPSITKAEGNGRDDRNHGDARVTFTKWVLDDPGLPGLLERLEGVIGGDTGTGIFKGEVLKETVDDITNMDEVVAFYHFAGTKHSFSAIIHLDFDLNTAKGVVIGVVTEGWLKGHAVRGHMRTLTEFQGHCPA